MSLLIAFTFNGEAARFDERRHLVVEKTNAIGTAYLRIDVLPAEAQPALREKFKQIWALARRRRKNALPSLTANETKPGQPKSA